MFGDTFFSVLASRAAKPSHLRSLFAVAFGVVWRLCQRVSGVSQLLLRVGLVRLVLCVLALLCVPWRAEMAPTPPVAAPSGVNKRGQRGSYKTLTMTKKAETIRQVEGGRPQSEVA